MKTEFNFYEQASNLATKYAKTHTIKFESTDEDIVDMLNAFKEKFSPEILQSLNDEDLLTYIFLTTDGNNDSLCYHLEFNPMLKRTFGSISGGSSFKFGLFQRQEDGKWITGSPKAPEVLSETDALQFGKSIRDKLVAACDLIKSIKFESVEDYERLDNALSELMGKFASYAWVQKYLHMIFPDKFVGWYVTDWLKHILLGFGITPSEKYYGMNGQLALIKKRTGYTSPHFQEICYAMFGEVRHFFRLESSDEAGHHAESWREKGIVAIGWNGTDDLLNYVKNGSVDRNKLADALKKTYYQNDDKSASRKAGEMKAFYESSSSSVFTVMDGSQLIAFVDSLSPYYYDASEIMAHQKTGLWHFAFSHADKLPENEGLLTSCYEIKKTENLLFLYQKYFWPQNRDGSSNNDAPILFQTGYSSAFSRNRIIFGAPGTGKSFTLNREKNALLANGGEYERVTFHPAYSYANFVGTYKPVPYKDENNNNSITYKYVPGPFMRTYVKALENSRSGDVKPFLLIIEEINRADVAAVFGDVFQLLDRDDNEISEYPVQASEDIKQYLSDELKISSDECTNLCLPDNMFIWATMNSADQGVFPMDTAFKRRWDFTYIGIDDNDEDIRGKTVILGTKKVQRVEWNKLRKAINKFLAKQKINEDKQLGPYFISRKIVVPNGSDEIDRDRFIETFKNKVIMYLFEDAAKQRRATLFSGCFDNSTRYSEICREFDEKGIGIFDTSIGLDVDPEDLPNDYFSGDDMQ